MPGLECQRSTCHADLTASAPQTPIKEDRPAYRHRVESFSDQSLRGLEIVVHGARDLHSTDSLHGCDAYCVCELDGKQVLRTKQSSRGLNPTWNERKRVSSYKPGDCLLFSIFDRSNPSRDELVGTARLASRFFWPEGFNGEVPLEQVGRGAKAFLNIRVRLLDPNSSSGEHSARSAERSREPVPDRRTSRGRGSENTQRASRTTCEDGDTEVMADGQWHKLRDRPEDSSFLSSKKRNSSLRSSEKCLELDLDLPEQLAGLVWRSGPGGCGAWLASFKKNTPLPEDHMLAVGDELVEIAGQPVQDLPIQEIRQLWMAGQVDETKHYLAIKLLASTLPAL